MRRLVLLECRRRALEFTVQANLLAVAQLGGALEVAVALGALGLLPRKRGAA